MDEQKTATGSQPGAGDAPPDGPEFNDGDVAQRAKEVATRVLTEISDAVNELSKAAAPMAREVGAKAAEVAAVAGQRAGPIAHKVADATEEVGHKLAARASDVAADLRRPKAPSEPAPKAESPSATASASRGADAPMPEMGAADNSSLEDKDSAG